jgi:hypothetical protein
VATDVVQWMRIGLPRRFLWVPKILMPFEIVVFLEEIGSHVGEIYIYIGG